MFVSVCLLACQRDYTNKLWVNFQFSKYAGGKGLLTVSSRDFEIMMVPI